MTSWKVMRIWFENYLNNQIKVKPRMWEKHFLIAKRDEDDIFTIFYQYFMSFSSRLNSGR